MLGRRPLRLAFPKGDISHDPRMALLGALQHGPRQNQNQAGGGAQAAGSHLCPHGPQLPTGFICFCVKCFLQNVSERTSAHMNSAFALFCLQF